MKKRLSLSIVSLALLLTGGLASCGKDSSAPGKESGNVTPASEVVSTAESSVQESTVEEKKVTPTTELSEGMEISGLSDEYKLGDTVKFTLTVPDWYVANTVVVKLNDQELTAEKVLDLTTAKKLVFAYVIETELDALRISAVADLISFAPAFVSAPEVEIVGLLEEYNPGSRVEFTLNAPARLTLTEVLVNAEAVLPDADGKYEYTLPMTAKELAIVANVENTKVNVVGSIKSNELDLLPRQAKDVSIQFTQDDVTFIAGEATYAEGALSYSATLPEFGTYRVIVSRVEDDSTTAELFTEEKEFDAQSVSYNIDVGDLAERAVFQGEDIVYDETVRGSGDQTCLGGLSDSIGYAAANEEYFMTFNFSYTGNIKDENGELVDDPTFGKNENKCASWSVGGVDDAGNEMYRFEMIKWGDNWNYKLYGMGTSNDWAKAKTFTKDHYFWAEVLKEWASEEGIDVAIARENYGKTGQYRIATYLKRGEQWVLALAIPVDSTNAYLGKMNRLRVFAASPAYETTQGKLSVKNLVLHNNARLTDGELIIKPHRLKLNGDKGTIYHAEDFTTFNEGQGRKSAIYTDPVENANDKYQLTYFFKYPNALNADGTINTDANSIGSWAGLGIQGASYNKNDGTGTWDGTTQFLLNCFHWNGQAKWTFRNKIMTRANNAGDVALTEEEIKAMATTGLRYAIQKDGTSIKTFIINGDKVRRAEEDITVTADSIVNKTASFPYYVDATMADLKNTEGTAIYLESIVINYNNPLVVSE